MIARIACLSAVLAAAACSSMGGMSDHTSTFRSALDDAQTENTRHADNCAATTSMTEMSSEMQRHGTAMDGAFGGMMDGMDMMSQCSCCDMASMQTMMTGVQTEETDHRTQMAGVADLGQAQSLCKSHTDTMRHDMDQMGTLAGSCMGK